MPPSHHQERGEFIVARSIDAVQRAGLQRKITRFSFFGLLSSPLQLVYGLRVSLHLLLMMVEEYFRLELFYRRGRMADSSLIDPNSLYRPSL